MKIVFVSKNKRFLRLCAKRGFKVFYGTFQEYSPYHEAKSIFYLSATNAFGYLEYGTDIWVRKMFPDLQPRLLEKIERLEFRTRLGRAYMPIGKCLATECESFTKLHRNFVITCPISLFPQNISATDNVYYSILGLLQLLQKYDMYISETDELVLPAIGCDDVAGLSAEASFQQIMKALEKQNQLAQICIPFQDILYKQPRTPGNIEFGLNP